MSNTFFRFKQFTIHQDKSAMKVSTDACIQGAWTTTPLGNTRVLDIGTGTGLLSLMLAQKNCELSIDAIEFDKAAAEQAEENVAVSAWGNKINVICADAVTYSYQYHYELIISNPPFFNNSLLGPTIERNHARHTITLTYQALFDVISKCLAPGGVASVLLPADNVGMWEGILSASNWQVGKKLLVYPRVGAAPNRAVLLCTQGTSLHTVEEHLYIRTAENSYTQEFEELMRPYYLNL